MCRLVSTQTQHKQPTTRGQTMSFEVFDLMIGAAGICVPIAAALAVCLLPW